MKSIAVIINIIFCIVNCVLGFMLGKGMIENKYFLLGMMLMILVDIFFYWMSVVIKRVEKLYKD